MYFDAIVPAGGRAARLGGVEKALLAARGIKLLDIALQATVDARATVVVGRPELPVPPGVWLVREDPPFGGPVAAVAAGMRSLPVEPADWVLLLAVDQPGAPVLVETLLKAAAGRPSDDGVEALVGIDPAGRRQWLAGLYRVGPLTAALRRIEPANASMRSLAADLSIVEVALPLAAAGDVDTPADLAGWRISRGNGSAAR